jgi:hypothetical protein
MKDKNIIFGVIFVFLDCVTNNFTYDKSDSENQQYVIIISEDITVVKFDENKVNWKIGYNI